MDSDLEAQNAKQKKYAPPIPRWKQAIDSALESDPKAVLYQLSTTSTSDSTPNIFIPRVRTHVHRGFLSFARPLSTAASSGYPLLLTTTDIRTPKALQISVNGNVEVAWYFPTTQEQFRITGYAYILPARDYYDASQDSIPKRLEEDFTRACYEWTSQDLDRNEWESRRRELFDSLSGHMRASWARPIPGTPLKGGEQEAKSWPETLPKLAEVQANEPGNFTRTQVEIALRHFALLVIEPSEVDYVELGVMPNRRFKFSREFTYGDWIEQEVVP